MPLVRIDVSSTLPPVRVAAVADSVHQALVATVDVPQADRFQVITAHDRSGLRIDPQFLDIQRSTEALIIAVTFRRGRTDDQKRNLYRQIVERASVAADMRPEDIMVVLTENTLSDWSFGNELAQYASAN